MNSPTFDETASDKSAGLPFMDTRYVLVSTKNGGFVWSCRVSPLPPSSPACAQSNENLVLDMCVVPHLGDSSDDKMGKLLGLTKGAVREMDVSDERTN